MEKGFKYDFFISYKHGTLDSMVAGYIQKKLERYKIPREIQKKSGKKKITRVFRDREELSVTANLTQEIEEQLKNTEYLIVICSPEARQSVWVNREVETFIRYRGMEYVLPVLIKGEPEDSFPDAIAGEEILAADVRGKDLRESKKKCKNELLRLIAPALNCSYDELRQRHRNYMFQRIAVAAVGVAVAGTGFATYSFRQAKRIDEEYQKAIRNQARYLSEISGELLNSGDRMGALKTALAILPKGKNKDEALVLEQEGALNNALYSYTDEEKLYFRASRMEETDAAFGESTINEQVSGNFDEKGNYYVTVDNKGVAYFYSVEEEKCVWKLDPARLTENMDEQIYTYTIIDEDRVAFRVDKELWIVSYKKKKIIKKIPLSGKCEGETVDRLVSDGEFLLFSDYRNECLTIYNLETGKQEYLVEYKKLGIGRTYSSEVAMMSWNSKKKEVILAVKGTSENAVGLFSYSFEKDEYKRLSDKETVQMTVLDDKRLAAIQRISDTDYSSQKEIDLTATSTYQFCVYDYTTGEKIWKENALETNKILRMKDCMMREIENGKKILIFYAGDAVCLVDADTYEVLAKENYGTTVVGVEQYDEKRLLIGFQDRSIYIMSTVSPTFGGHMSASQEPEDGVTGETGRFAYNADKKTAVQQYYREGKIVFLNILKDENAKKIEKSREIRDISYHTVEENGKEKTYRCILYEDILLREKEIIEIYEVGTSKLIYKLESEEEEIAFDHIKIGMQGNKLILCYTKEYQSEEDNGEWKNAELHIVDLKKGEEEKYCELGTIEANVLYTSDLTQAFSLNFRQLDRIDLTKDELVINEEEGILKEEVGSSTQLSLTVDDKYLIVTDFQVDGDFSTKSPVYLKVWDLENNQWKRINGKEKHKKIMSRDSVILGKEKPVIAVQKESGEIEIFNLSSGFKIATIEAQGKKNLQLDYSQSFFDQDEYYLLYNRNNNKISIWDIKKERQIMEKECGDMYDGIIYTDKNSEYFSLIQSGNIVFYKVDKDHRFGEYARVSSSSFAGASFEGNEILWQRSLGNIYYSKFYSFKELKQKAEKLLDGEVLTEEEKNEYFISE